MTSEVEKVSFATCMMCFKTYQVMSKEDECCCSECRAGFKAIERLAYLQAKQAKRDKQAKRGGEKRG